MNDLLAARAQMGMSLMFHIIFAVAGMAMPLMMVVAEWRWQRTGDEAFLILAKQWAKGTAILFAVGAVSGTVLSFELGLLWPKFMEFAGPIIGMPFSLEGFAFFAEAIFLGIYLYGWEKVSPRTHLASGVIVAASGLLSGIFVVIANAWMNTPAGFRIENGIVTDVHPFAAMTNTAAFGQTTHMALAAYASVGFAVAGIHAYLLLRKPANAFHKHAIVIALWVGGIAAFLQPFSGDLLARTVAKSQPAKFAALEGNFKTQSHAPLRIGGLPDVNARVTRYAIEIPGGLSFLAHGSFSAVVVGLDHFPEQDWPAVPLVHLSFQLMVGCGFAMMAVALIALWRGWRSKSPEEPRWFLNVLVLSSPLGFIALEAGWMVTELGRQPWIIYGLMRTKDAVTPMPGIAVPFVAFTLLYILLAMVVVFLLVTQMRHSPYIALVKSGAEQATDVD
ncbi:MAG: cytochrome ubiquinol oxidase subunit I [Terriglobales bacterium]